MSDAPDADAPDAEDDVAEEYVAEDGDAAPALVLADPSTGRGIVVTSWACTGLLAVASAISVGVEALQWVVVPVAIALAALGFVAFVVAYLTAIARSRTDEIAVAGVFLLIGCAPKAVQRSLLGSMGVQIVVALLAASMRPYTAVAFASRIAASFASRISVRAERCDPSRSKTRSRMSVAVSGATWSGCSTLCSSPSPLVDR